MVQKQMAAVYRQSMLSADAMIWLLKDHHEIILESKGAHDLTQEYVVPIDKIIDILSLRGCPLHALQENCQDCPIDRQVDPSGIPFQLKDKNGKSSPFWGSIKSIKGATHSEVFQLLEIRSWQSTQQLQQDRLMLTYLNKAQESERARIARDLHDGLAQSMYSLMLETRQLFAHYRLDEELAVKQLDTNFVELLQEIKTISSDLHPAALEDLGLLRAIFRMADQLKSLNGFLLTIEVKGTPFVIPKEILVDVYRVIQEAVNNTMKYSGVNQSRVSFLFEKNFLTIIIADDGKGFDTTVGTHGLGLWNMRERALGIGAEFTIRSDCYKGTTITLRLARSEVVE